MSLPLAAPPEMDPLAPSYMPALLGVDDNVLRLFPTPSKPADEIAMDEIPLPRFEGTPKSSKKRLDNVMPSKIPFTSLNTKLHGNEPSNFSATFVDLPPKNVQRKSKTEDRARLKVANDMLNCLNLMQLHGEVAAKDVFSMGQTAKKILEARNMVEVRHGNNYQKNLAWLDKGNMMEFSDTDSDIEEGSSLCSTRCSSGCSSGFQSKGVHPLILEKLQAMASLVNDTSCASP